MYASWYLRRSDRRRIPSLVPLHSQRDSFCDPKALASVIISTLYLGGRFGRAT